ncbi:MAG: DUF4352 domain-containing protein [Chloroflexia bacterium]
MILHLNTFAVRLLAMLLFTLAAAACGDLPAENVGEVDSNPTAAQTKEGDASAKPTAAPSGENKAAQKPSGPQNFKVGSLINVGDITMVVLGWEEPKGDEFNKPEAGNKFVAVDLVIVNKGQSAQNLSSLLQMLLKDPTGQQYQPDLLAGSATGVSSLDGTVLPGERLRGTIGFQPPKKAKNLTFVFDAEVFGEGKVFVALGNKPIAVKPPAKLPGETQQKMSKVGETIKADDLNITVNKVSSPKGDDFNKPSKGNKFLVVDVTITNNGKESADLSTLLQMGIKDATGQKYDVDLTASTATGGAAPEGEVAPGEKIRGPVGFQVPVNAKSLVFVFEADIFASGKLFVKLP